MRLKLASLTPVFANVASLPVLKDLRHSARGDDPPTKRLFGGFSARLPPSLVRGAVECLHSKTNLLSSERLINVAAAATPSALNPSSISLSRGRSGRRERSDERGGRGGERRGKNAGHVRTAGGEREREKSLRLCLSFRAREDRGQVLFAAGGGLQSRSAPE